MKKYLSLLLALVTVLFAVGCIPLGSVTEITRGSTEGNVYTNDVLGLRFTKPSSWKYATDTEISNLMNAGAELIGEDLKAAMEKNPAVYDMMASSPQTGTNVILGYENLYKTFASSISVERYIESLKNQFEEVEGITVDFPDTYETVTLGETEFTRVICTSTASGVTMKQVYYLHKLDGYMAYIIVTLVGGDTVADVEAMFA